MASELVDFHLLLWTIISPEDDLESSRLIDNKVSGLVLISEGVSADDDGFFPSRNESRDVADDDGFSEDGPIEDVPDGAIGTLPHLLKVEFLDSSFVGSDGCTLDAYFAFFDGFGGLDGDFVVSGISILDAEVEVLDL